MPSLNQVENKTEMDLTPFLLLAATYARMLLSIYSQMPLGGDLTSDQKKKLWCVTDSIRDLQDIAFGLYHAKGVRPPGNQDWADQYPKAQYTWEALDARLDLAAKRIIDDFVRFEHNDVGAKEHREIAQACLSAINKTTGSDFECPTRADA